MSLKLIAAAQDSPEPQGTSETRRILANRISPGLIDRNLAKAGYSSQLTAERVDDDARANLFEAVKGIMPHAAASIQKPRSVAGRYTALAIYGVGQDAGGLR